MTLWLDGPSPAGGARIPVSSSDPGLVSHADTAIVPVNNSMVSIPVTTKGVSSKVSVTFIASWKGNAVTKILDILPADLSSVVQNSCTVCGITGGTPTDITINLDGEAPLDGAVISLASNEESLIKAPESVTVPAGRRSIIVPLATSPVPENATITVTAQYRSNIMAVNIVLGATGKYSVTDLGIPPGYLYSAGEAINDSNDVIVNAWGANFATTSYIWRDGQKTYFDVSNYYGPGDPSYIMGRDINNKGHVTGKFGWNPEAFLWIDGVTSLLNISQISNSEGLRINDSDWIIGYGNGSDMIYREGNAFSILKDVPGATGVGLKDINNNGQVVGRYDNNADGGAFFWDNGKVSEIISSVSGFTYVEITAINDSGYVIGNINNLTLPSVKAFIWRDGNMKILPLPPGWMFNFAYGINNNGDIVGYIQKVIHTGYSDFHAMLYSNGTVYDLQKSITDTVRCNIDQANKINNFGYIVGTATIDGMPHAVLLTPPADLLTGVRPEELHTSRHLLGQNFPNPFNNSTTIPYSLPKAAHVRLTIIDMMGREVVVLTNELQLSGERSAEFDAEQLQGGVYFYRLQAGTYSEVKRLMLLK